MTDVPVNNALFNLTLADFLTTTPVDYPVMNAVWSQLLSNDAFLYAAVNALTSRAVTIGNVQQLQAALDGKANVSHTHGISEVLGLQAELDSLKGRVAYLETHATTPPPTGGGAAAGVITADFTSTTNGNRTYNFHATATSSTGSAVTAYQWTFGDGTSTTGADSIRYYSANGTYNVSLHVTTSDGASTTVTHALVVNVTDSGPAVVYVDSSDASTVFTSSSYREPTSDRYAIMNFTPSTQMGSAVPTSTRLAFTLQAQTTGGPVGSVSIDRSTYYANTNANQDFILNLPNYNGSRISVPLYASGGDVDGAAFVNVTNARLLFTY